jgi:putative (di)nucleoside polyphosphate hydrolase
MTAPEPLPYRPGVGILLFDAKGRVFLARRSDFADAWQMPQGGVDAGETPAEAALRELHEETGVASAEIVAETADWLSYDLPPELAAAMWGGRFRGQRQKWFAIRFLGEESEIDLGGTHGEFDRWRWAEPAQAIRLIVPFKRPLYEAVFRELAPWLRAAEP